VGGSDGRRAAEGGLAAAGAGAAGELAGQGQRFGEKGGDGGRLEGACVPGDLRRQLRLAAEGGLTVMSKPWRGLPRGSPPGGAGPVTVTVTGPPPQSRAMASGTVRSSP
jgi:hypothetical protein